MANTSNTRADGVREDRPIFSWQAPESVYRKKGANWFLSLAIVAIVISAGLYYAGLTSGAAVVLAGAAALAAISGVRPNTISCAIYQDGIVVGKKAFQFNQFKSFSFVVGELSKIKLDLVGQFAGEVVMPLKNIDFDQVRLYLKKHLPENESKGEDLMDVINRWLKF